MSQPKSQNVMNWGAVAFAVVSPILMLLLISGLVG